MWVCSSSLNSLIPVKSPVQRWLVRSTRQRRRAGKGQVRGRMRVGMRREGPRAKRLSVVEPHSRHSESERGS